MSEEAERPAELADVQGAWRRDDRRVDDGPWEEVSDVLWLQVGRYFCDVRMALPRSLPTHGLDVPQAFGGTVDVALGDIAFHHDLDSLRRDPAHPDVSTVHRADDVMYERGPGFEERWVLTSLPDDDGAVAELRPAGQAGPLARIVRVGALAVAVWSGMTPGGARYESRHGWSPERGPFRYDESLGVDEAVRGLACAALLPPGWVVLPVER